MKFNERGEELPDATPIEVPTGWKRPESLQEQIRRLIRVQMSQESVASGGESFEEANDFEVGDEDPTERDTRYTVMGEEVPYGQQADADVARRNPAGARGERAGARGGNEDADDEGDGDDSEGRAGGAEDGDDGRRGQVAARTGAARQSPPSSGSSGQRTR